MIKTYKYPALYAVCVGIGVLILTKSPTLAKIITDKTYIKLKKMN